ncbi:MAG: enamine deaminase RidA (YjgF/YER057c/UK114 family) [Gammaproteobacteria bacterium]
MDLDPQGNVQNPDNLVAQCNNSMDYVATLLEELGADSSDLVKLVVFYMGGAGEKTQILELITEKSGKETRPVINMVNLPQLCYPSMVIEIKHVAMRSADGSRIPRKHFNLDDMPTLP